MCLSSKDITNRLSSFLNKKELQTEEVYEPKRGCRHAAHCMYYAEFDRKLFDVINIPYAVLMQLRFDGFLGFIGGGIDENENLLTGLNREIKEETGVSGEEYEVTAQDHVVSHLYIPKKNLIVHFYAKKLSLEKLCELEKSCLLVRDHGLEVMGTVRVPTFTMDGYGGLPAFLRNQFVGNSRLQLMIGLIQRGMFSIDDIVEALETSHH